MQLCIVTVIGISGKGVALLAAEASMKGIDQHVAATRRGLSWTLPGAAGKHEVCVAAALLAPALGQGVRGGHVSALKVMAQPPRGGGRNGSAQRICKERNLEAWARDGSEYSRQEGQGRSGQLLGVPWVNWL